MRARDAASEAGAVAYADFRDMIGKVDAVSVAVPASSHHAVASAFLAAGVSVFVEKPLADTFAAARALAAAAEKHGAVLQVGHIERFNPAVVAMAERVGAPRRMSFRRLSTWNGRAADVDVILDLMIHDIDLALHFANAPVKSVAGSGQRVQSDTIDEAEAWLTFENGVIATLSASRVAARNERRVSISELGAVHSADLNAPSLVVTRRGEPPAVIELPPHDNLGAEIDAFVRSVAGGQPVAVDGEVGAAAVGIAERIRAAIDEADEPVRRSM